MYSSRWVQPDICILLYDAAVQTVEYGLVFSVLRVVHISHVVRIIFVAAAVYCRCVRSGIYNSQQEAVQLDDVLPALQIFESTVDADISSTPSISRTIG